jgi:glycosyltransferase involved in cell wall biosynthesis
MPDSEVNAVTLSSALDRVGRAEIVVGIPSLNSARTIGHVVGAVATGLAAHYPGTACAIVNVDGGSRDGTPELARRAANGTAPLLVVRHATRPLHRLATSYAGFPGRADALRAILRLAERLGARACALVDGDVRGITPEWVRSLLDPVLHDATDLVAPLYARHKYDGMITTNLIYPLTRALYGRRLRQAVGGHFGLSGLLAGQLLHSGAWGRAAAPRALDVWMSTAAIAGGLRVCQARLGAERRRSRGGGDALEASFTQAVGTLFELMEEYQPAWWAVTSTADVPVFGPPQAVGLEPVSVNVDRMISTYRQGLEELAPVWRRALGAATWAELAGLEGDSATDFRFPAELWARAVYHCAVAYHQRALPRRHLLRAMISLYLGRAAAFVLGTASADAGQAEAEIEALCGAFEATKPHLLDRWDARRP